MSVTIDGTAGINTPGLDSTSMPNSGGDPVVESGSNSDGEWVRLADGTQQTHKLVSITGAETITFPLAFFNFEHNTVATAVVPNRVIAAGSRAVTSIQIVARNLSGADDSSSVFVVTTGRWK